MPRLDPAKLPNFVQVVEESRAEYSNGYQTGFPIAELPPFASTDFTAQDTGNANPKFLRSSLYNVPTNEKMLQQASLPFTLTVTPFVELNSEEVQPPIIDFGQIGPIRCQRCLAYISPFFEFTNGGCAFRCPFCQTESQVHPSYFAYLGCDGRRIDLECRPELQLGSYEFVATEQYCKNSILPNEPVFMFLIDVSYQSVHSGMLDLLCSNLPDLLESLPREFNSSAVKIAIATYDQTVHFYDLNSSRPRMYILSDVNDVFVPFVEGLFVDFETAKDNLKRCLEDIRAIFSTTCVIETILGPAINVGLEALKSANRNGKLFVFHSNLPTFDAPGRLTPREDRKITNNEQALLTEATDYYNTLGKNCVKSGVCADIFLFPNAHIDIASIAPVSHLTGGSIYKYQYFEAQKDGRRFLNELHRDISRQIVFDVNIRTRTSMGIRPTGFYGSFYMDNVTDMQIGALDCDKSLQVELKYDDTLNEQNLVYIQVATLFTSCSGQRRIRIHNLTLQVTSDHSMMYGSVDQSAVFAHIFKRAESIVRKNGSKEMCNDSVDRCAQLLAAYREKCIEYVPFGQFILPEELRLLPLIVNCITKTEALNGSSEISGDDRVWTMSILPSLRIEEVMRVLYPNVIQITPTGSSKQFSTPLRASFNSLEQSEAYIIENGLLCFVWIGYEVSSNWIQNVFGAQAWNCLDVRNCIITERDNAQSRAVCGVLSHLNKGRSRTFKVFVVKSGDRMDSHMRKLLVEDRQGLSESYSEFLSDLHQKVRLLLDD